MNLQNVVKDMLDKKVLISSSIISIVIISFLTAIHEVYIAKLSDKIYEHNSHRYYKDYAESLYLADEYDLKKAAAKLTRDPDDARPEDTYKWNDLCQGSFGKIYATQHSKNKSEVRHNCELMMEHRKQLPPI